MISNQTQTTTSANFQQEFQHRSAWKAGVFAAFNVLAMILAIRLIVLTSVIGAISLTWLALQQPDFYRLGALAIYCAFCVVPTIFLACRR